MAKKTTSIINEMVPIEGAKLNSLKQELADYERERDAEETIIADLKARLETHEANLENIILDIALTKADIEDEESGNSSD